MKAANKNFSMVLQKFFKSVAKKKRVEVVKDVALEFYIRLTENSPVASGCYRANWGADIDKNYSGADKSLTKNDWSERESEVLEVIDSFSDKDKSIKFANNLPYARRIEFGWSQQAPNGVARISRAEILAYIKEKYGK